MQRNRMKMTTENFLENYRVMNWEFLSETEPSASQRKKFVLISEVKNYNIIKTLYINKFKLMIFHCQSTFIL